MKLDRAKLVVFLQLLWIPYTSLIIVWNMDQKESSDSISIKDELIGNKEDKLKPPLAEKVKSLSNYTLDQKCKLKKDLSIGFQIYTPYVEMGFTSTMEGDKTTVSGIIPHIVTEMVKYCCPDSDITFGNHFGSIRDVEDHFDEEQFVDISFPIYGLDGKDSTQYKDYPFVPLVTAPRLVLLVPDALLQDKNTRTTVLMATIFNAWPMLIFIVVSAMLAGLTVWLLDKKQNSAEFPPTFFTGAWEGIWWAFVTMTTVGYGDRSPKSIYARAFCIMWILMGIILISLFTGLVSAALSASATPVFNIPGSKIGAVNGSIEYQIGVGLNADMYAFDNHAKMISALIQEKKTLHAAIIDNYILSAIKDDLVNYKLRLEREVQFPVTYGVALREDSEEVTKCFRKYVRHHPQKIFEIIKSKLQPVENPTDEVSLEVQAAEKLFYEERVFKIVVYTEVGLLFTALFLGLCWEYCVRNKDSAAYRMVGAMRGKSNLVSQSYGMEEPRKISMLHNGNQDRMKQITSCEDLDTLINECERFHSNWMDKMKTLSSNLIMEDIPLDKKIML